MTKFKEGVTTGILIIVVYLLMHVSLWLISERIDYIASLSNINNAEALNQREF